MFRATTPTIELELETNLDVSSAEEVLVTFKTLLTKLNKKKNEISIMAGKPIIHIKLTQEETLSLNNGKVKVQVRFKMDNGKVYASEIGELILNNSLEEEVL